MTTATTTMHADALPSAAEGGAGGAAATATTAAAAAARGVEPKLYVLGNGSGSPCLDLSRVPAALADATVGVDLLVRHFYLNNRQLVGQHLLT
jgi:hypothetical protein